MRSPFLTRYAVFSLAALLAFQSRLPAPEAGPRIKVTIVTILATTKNTEVDKRLKCIAEEVKKKEPRLTGFQLVSMQCRSLAANEKFTFKLVDGQEAQVVVHHGADKENRVELKVKAPLQGNIVYGTVCGKFLPIVTRYKTKKDKDRLIIAVMVKPCHKKK